MDLPLVVIPSEEDPETQAIILNELRDAARLETLPASGQRRAELLAQADAFLVFAWRVKDEEIPHLERARLVQSVWAGTDRIPTELLKAHHPDVVVASGSGANAPQVAEHAVGLYLDLARRITWRDRALRAGEWTQLIPGRRVAGTRVAVLGYGAIGRRIARALVALDARVTAVNQTGALPDGHDLDGMVQGATLDALRRDLAAHAGVILALPLTPKTRGIVDRAWLQAMPRDGILVNVARGPLIVQADLLAHLKEHPDFMAGIDTWWRYPKDDADVREHEIGRFLALENVVATPHSAFNVPGARHEMIRAAAAEVARALKQ